MPRSDGVAGERAPRTLREVEVQQWDRSSDVVIVGLGIAGACAALEARRAGAEVLVIERASAGGGASAVSSGIFYLGAGTAVQHACGYEDDADAMFDFLASSTEAIDRDALRAFCDNSAAHFDWLEAQGVPFERSSFESKARPGQLNATFGLFSTGNEKAWPWSLVTKPTLRGHKVAAAGESAGAVAMQPLLARCEEEGVESIYDTAATALVVNDAGRVVGLHARQGRLDTFVRARRGVILATGGFGMNSEMVREYIPDIGENAEPLGVPTNDGSGILLGISAGGATRDLGGIIATCSIYPPERLINGIIVNKEGRRFVAEDVYHGRLAAFVMEQPDQTAWLIVNEETFAYPEAGHKLIDGWETVAEMERELGVPQGSIERTLADYNRDAKDGVDRRHHKHTDYLKPLDIGPWAAFDLSFKKIALRVPDTRGIAHRPERRSAQRQWRAHRRPLRGRRVRGPPSPRRKGLRQRTEPCPGIVLRSPSRIARGRCRSRMSTAGGLRRRPESGKPLKTTRASHAHGYEEPLQPSRPTRQSGGAAPACQPRACLSGVCRRQRD